MNTQERQALRRQFAAAALTGILSRGKYPLSDFRDLALDAYNIARTMIEEDDRCLEEDKGIGR